MSNKADGLFVMTAGESIRRRKPPAGITLVRVSQRIFLFYARQFACGCGLVRGCGSRTEILEGVILFAVFVIGGWFS